MPFRWPIEPDPPFAVANNIPPFVFDKGWAPVGRKTKYFVAQFVVCWYTYNKWVATSLYGLI
jgi:hypothetical protein